ncbi:MAG: helix-turn-helix domain-containing protein [Ligilactobacillus animalis]|uniref:helix-turn-helix domain-containing protein n=1 Tax=Ligilactobacillus animalis TaxID=1605 RepID=UPI00242E91B9|nr:helix-turn-helix domain-containing protein [Ligilactobacillus animalis]MCI5941463.1 helix-turn-helix domain-containing protein [Ligilactobacillus animalis]MDY2992930.1 helix-turn-helix domain-containing protein [Ligilactobacillus animalis]
MAEQEFTGVRLFLNIPAEVAHDPRFKSDKSILLFGEVYAMINVTGKFYMSNKELAKRLRCSKGTITNCVNELVRLGYITAKNVKDKETGAIKGREIKLVRYQAPIPIDYEGVCQPVEIPPTNPLVDPTPTDCDLIEHNNKSSNNNVQKQLEEDFNKLWKLYPRKEGKKKAYEAYKRAIKKGVTNKEIQTGIVKYLTQIKVQGTTKEYIKNGSTWFNQECWNDEYNVGQERSPVNPKNVPNSAPADRTVADLEREQRESRRDAFPMQYKNHPEWFTDEDVQNIIEEFPELREKVAEIDRARATSDRNTA